MNRIRKRFSRWGGGRLALALAPASRPLLRRLRRHRRRPRLDRLRALRRPTPPPRAMSAGLLERARLWDRIPDSARRQVREPPTRRKPETPKPGDQAFARVTLELIASNRLALEAAAKRAAELGLAPRVEDTPLAGEASAAGASVAADAFTTLRFGRASRNRRRRGAGRAACIWGGETTVTLGDDRAGPGGRCQELALAAARALAGAPERCGPAGGGDGRTRRPHRRGGRDRGRQHLERDRRAPDGTRRATSRRTMPTARWTPRAPCFGPGSPGPT